ncbi:MAG: hypothetical protein HFI86_02145 [Bacilli bacterium]|nr:hypothetical protein [Bacilli bacterium]
MNKKILKLIIRTILDLLAIMYLFEIICVAFKLPDEITPLTCIIDIIYAIFMVNLIEWSRTNE